MFFRDIAGQQPLKKKLIDNINKGRISHAQLFTGQQGVGKLALAIAYSRYLCCKNRQPDDACGSCSSCLKFNKLAHPDLNFFFPIASKKQGDKTYISKDYMSQWREYITASPYPDINEWYNFIDMENKQGIINAEDCNEVIKVLGYKSFESEYKIVIMWMIERLYHAAAPKLLKILEEPPEKTLFLLISENQDQVLNTILSRSQITKVPRLSSAEIVETLVARYNVNTEDAQEMAFLADGNFYKALSIFKSDETNENHSGFLRDWLRDCYRFDIKQMLTYVEELAKMGRERQKNILSFGIEIFRQCTLLNYNAANLVKAQGQTGEFISKFSSVLRPDIAVLMVDEFSRALYHVERNANPKILFTDLSLTIGQIFKRAKP